MEIDKAAQARILELEELLDDRIQVIDIQDEELSELREENRALRAQVQNMLVDHRYPDLKCG